MALRKEGECSMNTEQILKVLKAERDCKRNAHDYCWEYCESDCPYFVSYNEKMEVLDFLIGGYELMQKQGAEEYCIRCDTKKLSQEELGRLIRSINQEPFLIRQAESIEAEIKPLPPDYITKILGGTD